jgi:hypothetical protein
VTLIHKDSIDALRVQLLTYTERFSLNPEMFVLHGSWEAGEVLAS